ncbi:MAG TPA: CopG family transcriptional regulator [Candidatus Saccharimonadales bacterium]|jgi:hypothetical protein
MKRVTFYLDDDEYRSLKIVLAIHGMSASEWLRHQMAQYVKGAMPNVPLNELKNYPRAPKREIQHPKPDNFNEDIDLQ